MAFPEYEMLPDVRLDLPIAGKVYTIRGVANEVENEKLSAALAAALDPSQPQISDEEFYVMTIGQQVLDEMRADKVSPEIIALASMTAATDRVAGRGTAEQMWITRDNLQSMPEYAAALAPAEAPKPVRAPRKAPAKKAPVKRTPPRRASK